jgi:outer membrane beta-barrel protein
MTKIRNRRRRAPVLAVLLLAGGIAWSPPALAVKDEAVAVIQKRHFRLGSEFYLDLGGLVLDPFTKDFAPTIGWVAHISDHLAWEIFNGTFIPSFFEFRSKLRQQLEDIFGVPADRFDRLQMFATTGLVWSPLYGKFSVFNHSNLYADLSFTLAAGVARYVNDSLPIFPIAVAGLGIRFYMSQHWSLRLDTRNFILFHDLKPRDDLYVGLGIALNFGGGS